MTMFKFLLRAWILSIFCFQQCSASSEVLDYDQVRAYGGFNSKRLKSTIEIMADGESLLKEEIEDLVTSKTLKNLRDLDLSNQALIDDEVIKKLANNLTFSHLKCIRLENTSITNEAIQAIRESEFLGRIQGYPSISGRYGRPSAEIDIYTKKTKVTVKHLDPLFDFHIEYQPANPDVVWDPAYNGVKIINIKS